MRSSSLQFLIVVLAVTAGSPSARFREASAQATPTTDCDHAASSFAKTGLDDNEISLLSGCYRNSAGAWFDPGDPDDPRLPEPILSPDEAVATQALRVEIVTELDAFEAQLKTTEYAT